MEYLDFLDSLVEKVDTTKTTVKHDYGSPDVWRIIGHVKATRKGGTIRTAFNTDELFNAVIELSERYNHVRVFTVDSWMCSNCKYVNYNRTNNCSHCGRKTKG